MLCLIEKKVAERLDRFSKSSFFDIELLCCIIIEPVHEISNNVVYATSKASDQPAHMRSLIRAFASSLNIPCG